MKNSFFILLITLAFSCREKHVHTGNKPENGLSSHQMEENELHLTDQQILLGNIKIDPVKEHTLEEEILITGVVNVNQKNTTAVSTRVMGRIERLYFKNAGETIRKGEPLYDIYSEDLNMAVRELRLASEKYKALKNDQVDLQKILLSAKNKLRLWGLTVSQIDELERSPEGSRVVTIVSPASGVIVSTDVREGDYIMEGASTFHLADLSALWIEGQLYSDQVGLVKEGMEARVTFPGFPGREHRGKISFINPELNKTSKINGIRLEVPNQDMSLIPGTQAYIHITTKTIHTIAVPADAIILEERSSTVWVNTGRNMFTSRMVTTGLEANGLTEIKSGLQKGDTVVISGAYLLNSEFIFQKGINPMEGHDMHH